MIRNTFRESNVYILTRSTGTSFLSSSSSTFLATDVLQSMAILTFFPSDPSISFRMIYSQISKLLAPVSASVPLRPLKLTFCGRLNFRFAFIAQGGFPIKSVSSLRCFVTSYEKKFPWVTPSRGSLIRSLHLPQYSLLISTPTASFTLSKTFNAAFRKFSTPHVGSMTTAGLIFSLSFNRLHTFTAKYPGVW